MKMDKKDYIKPNKIFFDPDWELSKIYEMQEEFLKKVSLRLAV